jgi:uncharacterized protein
MPALSLGTSEHMSLNPNAQIDTSQVEDQRGASGGFGGAGLPTSGRGGVISLVVALLVVLLGGGYAGSQLLGPGGTTTDPAQLNRECATSNPNRLSNQDCRNVLYVNSVQAFWQTELPAAFRVAYQPADTVFFQQQTLTACGLADTGMGPFYCGADRKVYLDLSFYQELTDRFGARGEFAQPYVLAHEYGHHVQDLLGTLSTVEQQERSNPGRANRLSVALELQADCYAGVWGHHAGTMNQLDSGDIAEALNAATAIGDDRLQKEAQGRVVPESFTHGSSAQRVRWFKRGLDSGRPQDCDTFAAASL